MKVGSIEYWKYVRLNKLKEDKKFFNENIECIQSVLRNFLREKEVSFKEWKQLIKNGSIGSTSRSNKFFIFYEDNICSTYLISAEKRICDLISIEENSNRFFIHSKFEDCIKTK